MPKINICVLLFLILGHQVVSAASSFSYMRIEGADGELWKMASSIDRPDITPKLEIYDIPIVAYFHNLSVQEGSSRSGQRVAKDFTISIPTEYFTPWFYQTFYHAWPLKKVTITLYRLAPDEDGLEDGLLIWKPDFILEFEDALIINIKTHKPKIFDSDYYRPFQDVSFSYKKLNLVSKSYKPYESTEIYSYPSDQ